MSRFPTFWRPPCLQNLKVVWGLEVVQVLEIVWVSRFLTFWVVPPPPPQAGLGRARVLEVAQMSHVSSFQLKSPGKKHKQGMPRQEEALRHAAIMCDWWVDDSAPNRCCQGCSTSSHPEQPYLGVQHAHLKQNTRGDPFLARNVDGIWHDCLLFLSCHLLFQMLAQKKLCQIPSSCPVTFLARKGCPFVSSCKMERQFCCANAQDCLCSCRLAAHYEVSPVTCLWRTSVYQHYCDECCRSNTRPVTLPIFSKVTASLQDYWKTNRSIYVIHSLIETNAVQALHWYLKTLILAGRAQLLWLKRFSLLSSTTDDFEESVSEHFRKKTGVQRQLQVSVRVPYEWRNQPNRQDQLIPKLPPYCCRYYYLGMDIKQESDHYHKVKENCVLSPKGKPKVNRGPAVKPSRWRRLCSAKARERSKRCDSNGKVCFSGMDWSAGIDERYSNF